MQGFYNDKSMDRTIEYFNRCVVYYFATYVDSITKFRPIYYIKEVDGKFCFLTMKIKDLHKQTVTPIHAKIYAACKDG